MDLRGGFMNCEDSEGEYQAMISFWWSIFRIYYAKRAT